MLVGLSTDYYLRLEQGRGGHPSETVVDALARVLLLDESQQLHLRHLARPPKRRGPVRRSGQHRMAEPTRVFLDTLTVPAIVITKSTQVIGWNALACTVMTDFGARPQHERNAAWLIFLDDELAARHRRWETAARNAVGLLRMTAGEMPTYPGLDEVIGNLSVRSEMFRRLWSEHHVHQKTSGLQPLRHPEVGDIDLTYLTWTTPGAPDQMLITYTAEPHSPSAHALNLLASIDSTRRAGTTTP